MKPAHRRIAIHLAFLLVTVSLLVLCTVYPFFAGGYDRLAVPLSTMAQVFGVAGMALVPVGLLWLAMPKHGFVLSIVSTTIGTGVALLLALFATLSVGNAFGVLTCVAWVFAAIRFVPRLKSLKNAENSRRHPAAMYLVCLPVVTLAAQIVLRAPMMRMSRDRAIARASQFIGDIEQYHASRMLRKPVFGEGLGAAVAIFGGSEAQNSGGRGRTASVWRLPRRFRGARSCLRPGVRPV